MRDQAVKSPPFVADVAHGGADGVIGNAAGRTRPQQLVQRGRRRPRVEPRREVYAVEDDRHPLVQVARRFVRRRRDDGTRLDRRRPLRPHVPQPGEREQAAGRFDNPPPVA